MYRIWWAFAYTEPFGAIGSAFFGDSRSEFWDLCVSYTVVNCCRISPAQKYKEVVLVTTKTEAVTLRFLRAIIHLFMYEGSSTAAKVNVCNRLWFRTMKYCAKYMFRLRPQWASKCCVHLAMSNHFFPHQKMLSKPFTLYDRLHYPFRHNFSATCGAYRRKCRTVRMHQLRTSSYRYMHRHSRVCSPAKHLPSPSVSPSIVRKRITHTATISTICGFASIRLHSEWVFPLDHSVWIVLTHIQWFS